MVGLLVRDSVIFDLVQIMGYIWLTFPMAKIITSKSRLFLFYSINFLTSHLFAILFILKSVDKYVMGRF